jgi:hypothetical protein
LELSEIEELILARAKTPHFTAFHRFFLEQPAAVPKLVALALSKKAHPVPAYSAWLLVHLAKAKPSLVAPFQDQLTAGLLETSNHSIQRSLLVVLLELPIKRRFKAELLNYCFEVFAHSDSAVANRVYALYHLKRFVKTYPEIDQEVKAQIGIIQELGEMKPALKVGIRNYLNA